MAEHKSNDHHSASTIEVSLNVLRLKLSDAGDSSQKLDEILDWVREQKKKERDKAQQIPIEDVGKGLTATINAMEKFKSEDPQEITSGVLDIISSAGDLVGKPYGPVLKALCSIISVILTKSKPQKPSVVDQLAKLVHNELVHFNKRLQDQQYDGLKRRVSDQQSQVSTMKPGEKLDDPNLWNDYVQFMGELSNRFESPLPFKFEANLTSDPDVADFVTAVVTYCEAYACFMALLIAAKGKFAELGSTYEEDENTVDRKISCQTRDAKNKLSFFSKRRYLTFLGRLPYEGGKLTKIIVLSRNMRGKSLVEAVRGSLGLTQMQNLAAVEEAASKVACQSVKVKVDGHQVPLGGVLYWCPFLAFFWVQFINETDFPMKIVSGRFGWSKCNLEFVQDVQPRASFHSEIYTRDATGRVKVYLPFSTGGYIMIYLNGILSSSTEPPTEQARLIEFALSAEVFPLLIPSKINIQDKTADEFSHGQDTYKKMKCGNAKTLYWFENGTHFMAKGEIVPFSLGKTLWRFSVQDFDPCSVQDVLIGDFASFSNSLVP